MVLPSATVATSAALQRQPHDDIQVAGRTWRAVRDRCGTPDDDVVDRVIAKAADEIQRTLRRHLEVFPPAIGRCRRACCLRS